ncbi:MAG: 23S rRNA (guanosine(2251)-2'-O)-methyltransferase RlmB [Chitinophagales bacterium]|nr:23S rRNA (guanosine(2251)-2'-O)-methyltransferase RlmB [Chitinophagales bacterium]
MKKKEVFIGRQAALEILRSDKAVEKIMLQKGASGAEIEQIRKICEEKRVAVQVVPKEKINYLLFPIYQHEKANHQGVVGLYGEVQYFQLDDIYQQVLERGELALFLVLDGITDVRNFGAIARTAEAMGVHAIVVPEKGVAQINSEAVKSSAGAIHNVPICREKALNDVYKYFKLNGIQIVGSSLKTSKSIRDIDFTLPTAIVLGSEGKGISLMTKDYCDQLFIIPMKGSINSLNVSVSCGMILYEVDMQRNLP